MIIKRKYVIEKTSYPIDGIYNYNAQVYLSVNESSFAYCGIGKFCKTYEDAEAYCIEYENNHK